MSDEHGAVGGEDKRSRKKTEAGQAMYESIRNRQLANIERLWSEINFQEDLDGDMIHLREKEKTFLRQVDKYLAVCSNYQLFLERTYTSESRDDLQDYLLVYDGRYSEIESTKNIVDEAILYKLANEHLSSIYRKSKSSSCGRSSQQSSFKARMKAEAAKQQLQYAVKESELKMKQAVLEEDEQIRLAQTRRKKKELEAELDVLKVEKEVAVAEAEVLVAEEGDLADNSIPRTINLPSQDPRERTGHYIQKLENGRAPTDGPKGSTEEPFEEDTTRPRYELNPYAPVFNHVNPTAELGKFLLRKDLLLSRLRTYDEKPETYAVWKTSFLSVMRELDVTPSEEMDLLIKWLGPESSKQALSLRASNFNDTTRGLQQIWQRLNERYGSPEMVENTLRQKLDNFPKLSMKDNKKLYELSDLLSEIEAVKMCKQYRSLLAYFDSASGVSPIVCKLPFSLQEKWKSTAFRYKEDHNVPYPPFTFFVKFIRDLSRIRNDPSFSFEQTGGKTDRNQSKQTTFKTNKVFTKKTEINPQAETLYCPYHGTTKHSLNQCRSLKSKSYSERKEFLKKHGFCYRCCTSNKHLAKNCMETVKCNLCGHCKHPTFLHVDQFVRAPDYGGEKPGDPVTSKCTQICGQTFGGKSCAKTVLVRVYHKSQPDRVVKAYAILDDQSNVTLARSELFDALNIDGEPIQYTISSCAGLTEANGRKVSDLVVESLDRSNSLDIANVIECSQVPDLRDEIPTPEIVCNYPHLQDISIPQLDNDADIWLLIGRDVIEAHHVLDQRIGSPYAQLLPLGWVVIGESCLRKVHQPNQVTVNKTYLYRTKNDQRATIFQLCHNDIHLNEIFALTQEDEQLAYSAEDLEFLELMDKEMVMGPEKQWIAPLPFKQERPRLPSNKSQALKRAYTLDRSLQRDEIKKKHFVDFMKKLLDSKHAEVAPDLKNEEEHWYLPIFGVYHPKKPGQIRAVFDSSTAYDGVSLNDVLLQGPDLMNSLLGVLMRFRKEEVAVMADIQSMFHCFQVREEHRNFLRFYWYEDNNPSKELIEYRMRVHVFGNKPSPAVATYGLRKAAIQGEEMFGHDTREFVENEFYVDDGLSSCPSEEEMADLLKRTQKSLQENGCLRLHKVVSNRTSVMTAFPREDLAKDLMNLDLTTDTYPLQRSLGLLWNINTDTFVFQTSRDVKPCTRRGILSTVHSIFDPLGFIAPIVIQGKVFLRELVQDKYDWDQELEPDKKMEWERWRDSLTALENIEIPRMYVPTSFRESNTKELHVFSDASEKTIASSAYLKMTDKNGSAYTGFVFGKAKVVPNHAHTIPRLELCASVLAVEVAGLVTNHLDLPPDCVHYYTDSRIVLGYINNTTKRFKVYVSNRVQKIKAFSEPNQWSYVPTSQNPADAATRPVSVLNFNESGWLKGSPEVINRTVSTQDSSSPTTDEDFEETVCTASTKVSICQGLGSQRFERFSEWKRLVRAIALLKRFICSRNKQQVSYIDAFRNAELVIIREVQKEVFRKEIECLQNGSLLPRSSNLVTLNPYLDENGLLCVGGRLRHLQVETKQKSPIIIPRRHQIGKLLVRHYHSLVKHQGRHFTEGAIREAGYWIIGGKRLISSVIHRCVKCRKLRGKQENQIMADLPSDRLTPAPPFTYTGVDAFGPWTVASRKTRGGLAQSKRWAILFTCLVCRAIHIELVEEMSSLSFINALRRFIAIRGKVKEFRSDKGTNFVGSSDILGFHSLNVEDGEVGQFLNDNQTRWIFNAPHSSHMGGAWERMIGTVRRILDSMLADISPRKFTHEVLSTLMQEVCAIVNSRPIVPVSTDPDNPFILTPSVLLTQKTGTELDSFTIFDDDTSSLFKAQWKQVQSLANTFWKRWRDEYLHTLQKRRKWNKAKTNIKDGDFVLLIEKNIHRNEWPVGIIQNALTSNDGKVRKAVVRLIRDGKATHLTRPITEMILLM